MCSITRAREDLLSIFQAGLAQVDGRPAVRRALGGEERAFSVIAIGKAAQAMALGAVDALGGRALDGLVISKPGHLDLPLLNGAGLRGIEGGHPVPNENSLEAGEVMIDYIQRLPTRRPILFLISGGASGLVEQLLDGVDLALLQRINRWLLGSGLSIGAMNRVRKAISAIKGGGLINYLGQRPVRGLLISDVPGDDPAVIGSGLLVPDEASNQGLTDLNLPDWLTERIPDSKRAVKLTNKPAVEIIACLRDAREAAATKARELGYPVHLSHAHLGADAATTGRRLALELMDTWPGIYIWGGEPTVCLPPSPGRGGRNQHLALSAATVIAGCRYVCLLAAGTDGGDGPTEDAGALVDGGTVGRGGRRAKQDPEDCLARADAGSFLAASKDLLRTGPTGTNVMDLVIGLRCSPDVG